MTVDIRLIGSPEEVSEAESLLRDRFVIHSMRHYASRHSDDGRRAYIRASPRGRAGSEVMEVPEDIADLKVRLRDLGDRNNVFLCYSFKTDRYIDHPVAHCLNTAIQNDLREIVDGVLEGVDGRLDQTYKRTAGSIIAYRSGSGNWLAFPVDKEGIE